MNTMHEIDYKIFGDDMQFVEVELDPNEATVAEAGGMMYMEDGIEMETIFGDGSQQQGGFLGALMGAGKRLLTGESLFMTVFLNRGAGRRSRSRSARRIPARSSPIHLAEIGRRADRAEGLVPRARRKASASASRFSKKLRRRPVRRRRLHHAAPAGRRLGVRPRRRHAACERTLGPGEMIRVDTGCIVAFQPSVNYDIQYVGKIKSALFGGEGLFFATLRGPGRDLAAVAAAQPAGEPDLCRGAASRRGGRGRRLDPRRAGRSARRR